MSTDRRHFLAGTAAAGALAAAPPLRAQAGSPLSTLFDGLVQAQLRRSPEQATNLGLDSGANADLRAKLSDQSPAAVTAAEGENLAELRRLEAVDRRGLSMDEQVDLDAVLYTRRSAAAVHRFEFGGSGYGPSPYVISQQTGAYQSVPDFLDTKHKVETAGDADAYLQRLRAFGQQVDAQTGRMRADVGKGVVPPDFLLDLTITQLEKLAVPADQALVVNSLATRAGRRGWTRATAATRPRCTPPRCCPRSGASWPMSARCAVRPPMTPASGRRRRAKPSMRSRCRRIPRPACRLPRCIASGSIRPGRSPPGWTRC
jgi:uncharacterized protein (DUF885 family)